MYLWVGKLIWGTHGDKANMAIWIHMVALPGFFFRTGHAKLILRIQTATLAWRFGSLLAPHPSG